MKDTPHKRAEDKWWDQVRARGKFRFVLIRGGLMWGLSLGIIWNAIDLFRTGLDQFYILLFPKGLFMIFGFILGGCLFAAYQWNVYEQKPTNGGLSNH